MSKKSRSVAPAGAIVIFLLGLVPVVSSAPGRPATAPATPAGSELRDHLVDLYLNAKWDELEGELTGNTKEINALPAPQKAEVLYVRQALAECRPAWWSQCKAGKKVTFRAIVWNRPFAANYEDGKQGVQVKSVNGVMTATVGWPASEMDSTEQAEHGFTKGDLCDLAAWAGLGNAEGWASVPAATLVGLDERGKARFGRYLEFHGNVTGAYYGTPRARRWELWLGLAAYMEKYAKAEVAPCRRAVGAMLLAEVVGNPAKYPTITMPASPPADDVEAKLADHVKAIIEKQSLTLAEDQALRDALKAFALANMKDVHRTAKIVLPNKLLVMLDADLDGPERTKRDAWLKEHLEPGVRSPGGKP